MQLSPKPSTEKLAIETKLGNFTLFQKRLTNFTFCWSDVNAHEHFSWRHSFNISSWSERTYRSKLVL